MKRKYLLLIALTCFLGITNAQNPEMKQAFGLKLLFMDYIGLNGGDATDLNNYTNGLELSYGYNLAKNFNVNVPLRVGVAQYPDSLERSVVVDLGAHIHAQLWEKGNVFTPYIMSGINGVYDQRGGDFTAMLPIGIGVDVRLSKNAALNFQAEYRKSLTTENRDNLHHGLGFKYLLGEKEDKKVKVIISDFDNDGVPDTEDLCPEVKGSVAMKGCPDQDGDGIADFDDECPNAPGAAKNGGCPDRDGDGVVDIKDKCPDSPGVLDNDGCPLSADRDGDGIPDDQDKCPYDAGLASTEGCPDSDGDGIINREDACPDDPGTISFRGCPDSDGDGIHDGIDKCPGTPGLATNGGCPTVNPEVKEVLDFAKKAVQFDTGKTTLKLESRVVLDQIVQIMRVHPTYNLNISGHTDSVGDALKNLTLSEGRAKTCYDYLISKGIDARRLSYVGYGETRPIASNATAFGKSENRRVEFEVKFK